MESNTTFSEFETPGQNLRSLFRPSRSSMAKSQKTRKRLTGVGPGHKSSPSPLMQCFLFLTDGIVRVLGSQSDGFNACWAAVNTRDTVTVRPIKNFKKVASIPYEMFSNQREGR